MSRTGPALSRRDRSQTGLSITHSACGAGGALTASASSPSFCKPERHSSSGEETAGGGCAGVVGLAGGDDGPGPCSRGRGGGSGATTVTSGTSMLTRTTAAVYADRLEAI